VTHHDELLAGLRRVASAVDGPPDAVIAAARAAFLARDLDGALAVLIADSRVPDGDASSFETVRTALEPTQGRWLLSFFGGGVQVDMEVDDGGDRVRLLGQFSGASGDEYYLESAAGRRRIEVDAVGRFIVDDVDPGPVRLRCRGADGTPITTAWVSV
jgi:hypothetical protein